jgi:hypothetical protein
LCTALTLIGEDEPTVTVQLARDDAVRRPAVAILKLLERGISKLSL